MKHLLFSLSLLFVTISTLSACRETINTIIEDHVKNQTTDYLHNETDQDVTVFFRPREQQTSRNTYFVPKGRVVEIPDSIRLGVVCLRYMESDSVVFVFADGTRVVHTYTNTSYGQDGVYRFSYQPEVNNIYYTGYDVPTDDDSWVLTILGTHRYRMDYYIRKE